MNDNAKTSKGRDGFWADYPEIQTILWLAIPLTVLIVVSVAVKLLMR